MTGLFYFYKVKILVIRFSSIGDIVLTTPVIRCIKKQLPESEIHFITKKQFQPVLMHNPYIGKLWLIEKEIDEVVNELKKEKFDYVIDLHHNLRSLRLKLKLSGKKYSFRKLNVEKWLMVNLKKNKLPDLHIVDRYMETVAPLNVKNDNAGLDYFLDKSEEVEMNTLPESHRNGFIGFAIGAQYNTKKLPVEKIISICKKINQPVILLGGKEDVAAGEKIRNEAGEIIYNACGKYSLNQSASLVKQSELIITHDTGLMHIAAAFNKKIISVWGNTIPEFGMYPYMPGHEKNYKIAEVNDLPCRPCSKIGFSECPKKHFKCMREIDEELIVKWVKEGF